MASNSKSGLSKLEREKFLYDHGFVVARQGKGDHTVWEHPALKELAKKEKIVCPPNLLHNPAQLPWEHTVPDNPANGTWHRIAKHAEWCQETVEGALGKSAEEERRRKVKQDFRDAWKEICDWKRETKHRLRTGIDTRPAPDSYRKIDELKARL